MTKYIAVVGGSISGVGKGICTASLGRILKAYGFKVTAIKIDPYLNFDAGTMRPTEHGECWVTYDGGETDQDLGTYERFLNVDLSRKNNLTTGQVYSSVIKREREGKYLGKTVQFIPHIPNEIVRRIELVSKGFDIAQSIKMIQALMLKNMPIHIWRTCHPYTFEKQCHAVFYGRVFH